MREPGSETLSDWLDRHSGRLFVMPAVLLILAFSIFPLVISVWLALSRFKLAAGGYELRFVWLLNFRKLLFGSEQYHFLGTFIPKGLIGWAAIAITLALIVRAILGYVRSGKITVLGSLGRAIAYALFGALVWMLASTIGQGGQLGSLGDHAVLRGLRAPRAVHHRHRARLAVRAENLRTQLLPRRVLHSADGDAGRHRLHLPHAGRHDCRPVRAAVAIVRFSAISNGQPTSGRPA